MRVDKPSCTVILTDGVMQSLYVNLNGKLHIRHLVKAFNSLILKVLLDRLTWQDVHIAVLGDVAGLFGLFHGESREDSGDALRAETNRHLPETKQQF